MPRRKKQSSEAAVRDIRRKTRRRFSADETADVGVDGATPVTEEYAERDNEFNGLIDKVTVELI